MKLTIADNKFISEFIVVKEAKTLTNIFSGEEVDCNPLVTALVTFIWDLQLVINRESNLADLHPKLTNKNMTQKFDRARNIVRKLNPTVYMTLID